MLETQKMPLPVMADWFQDQGREDVANAIKTIVATGRRPNVGKNYYKDLAYYWVNGEAYKRIGDPLEHWLSEWHWRTPDIPGLYNVFTYSPDCGSEEEAYAVLIDALSKHPELWLF